MKKIFIILVLFQMTVIYGCVMNNVNPGDMVTKTYEVSEFTKLDVSHAFEIIVKVGETASLEITAGENIHPIIEAIVKGDKLVLGLKESMKNTGDIKAEITVLALDELQASGACKVHLTGVDTDEFMLDASGATRINIKEFKANSLTVDMSGASSGAIQGEVNNLNIDISGASGFDSEELMAENVVADLSGACNAKVYASKYLKVDASGASNLTYLGDPEKVEKDTSGASNIKSK